MQDQQHQYVVRDLRHKEKFQMDDAYMNGYAKICGVNATLVYMDLCRHANKAQEAWPSTERLAQRLPISERSVRYGIQTLEEHGIIGVIRGIGEDGKRKVNVYVLIDRAHWSKTKMKPPAQYAAGPAAAGDTSQRQTPAARGADEGYKGKDTHLKERKTPVDKSESTDGQPMPIRQSLDDIRRDLERRGILKPRP